MASHPKKFKHPNKLSNILFWDNSQELEGGSRLGPWLGLVLLVQLLML